ncbi:MAG: phosphatase PAP2 family protein [Bacteroidota bacterium]
MKPIIITIVGLLSLCVSSFSQETLSKNGPYSLHWTTDGITFGSAFIVAFTASAIDDSVPMLTIAEINVLNKDDINPIDRITAGTFSKTQSQISDVLVGAAIVSPFALFLDEEIRNDFGTISTMYLETVLFSTFTPSYGKGGVKRIRPYVYGNSASLADKQDGESRRSFFSGHATWAFSTSIFFANVYLDYYPDTQYKEYIWGGAIGLASTVSILRVTSGAHFISDIVVGAAVGSTIGYVIPYIHRKKENEISFQPIIAPNYRGFSFTYHIK